MKKRGQASPEEKAQELKQFGRELQPHERIKVETDLRLKKIGRLLLTNEDAKLLLAELEDAYCGSKIGTDPYQTYQKLGREEVVQFLRDLRDGAQE